MKNKKRIILIAANAFCLLCLLVGVIVMSSMRGKLPAQQAAERWRGDNETQFAQVSVFTPENSALTENDIMSFRGKLDSHLSEAGVIAHEDERLWTDAFCTVGTASVGGNRGSAQAKALAVGGNFFQFHPLRLLDGQYISESDLMQDKVIVNEMLAWKLYGGTELAGMTVNVNGHDCIIAGVVDVEDDFASEHAFDRETPLLFMSYSMYASEQTVQPGITTYEIVMPNPLTDYARKHVADNLGSGAGVLAIENSGRFSNENVRKVLGKFGERAMRTSPIELPYWENAAIYLESCLALVWALMLPFYILPIVTAAWLLIKLIKLGKREAKRGMRFAGEALEKRKERRWDERTAKKQAAVHTENPPSAVPEETEPQSEPDVESIIQEILSEKQK